MENITVKITQRTLEENPRIDVTIEHNGKIHRHLRHFGEGDIHPEPLNYSVNLADIMRNNLIKHVKRTKSYRLGLRVIRQPVGGD